MKPMLKKLGIILGALIALLVITAIVVPMVVDVDQYRPQIVQKVNEQLNGKFELGKLSLSLWGQIRIGVASVNLQDTKGRKILTVSDSYFHLPFSSIFSGSPEMIFKMSKPAIHVVQDKAGKINLLSLVKMPSTVTAVSASGSTASAPPVATPPESKPAATPAAPAAASKVALPAMALNARLGIELRDAQVLYRDEKTDLTTEIQNLNFVVRDISLSRPLHLEMWADLNTKMGKLMTVKGPARLKGQATPQIKNGAFEKVKLSLQANMDDLDIQAAELFHKKSGIPMNGSVSLEASEKVISLQQFIFKFHNAEVTSSGSVENFDARAALNFQLKTNDIQLKAWTELVPMLKEFELGGAVRLSASASGPMDQFAYNAKIAATQVTAKAPMLKAKPQIDAAVDIGTDEVRSLLVTLKAPGSDLQIKGKVVSFTKPRVDIEVTSKGMDLDQLIEFPKPGSAVKTDSGTSDQEAQKEVASSNEGAAGKAGAGKAGETANKGTKGAADKMVATKDSKGKPVSDFDAMLNPFRENPILRAMIVMGLVDIKMLKIMDVKITDIYSRVTFKDLVKQVDPLQAKVFGGSVKMSMSVALAPAPNPKMPTYKFGMQVANLELKQAVESQFQFLKNTLLGKANFQMVGEGVSFNPEPAIDRLKAKGSMKVENATFATIDVAKMVGEGLSKSLDKVGDKVPQLKGKKLNIDKNIESKYESVTSDFTIADGKFSSPNFFAKAAPNQGIDLKGSTTVGLKDFSLNTRWEVIDTYNLTKGRDLSVEQGGVRVEHILAEGNGPLKFPVSAGCQITSPCYSYTEVPEYLGKVAMGNVSAALSGKAKAEIKKKADSLIQQAPPSIQKGLDDLKNKFFR